MRHLTSFSDNDLFSFRFLGLKMPTSCTPWMSFHGLGLKGSHLNRANSRYSLRSQKYYDSMLLNRLICVRNDDFDDSEFGEPSYIYATRFCRSAGSEDILALANEDGKVIIQVISKMHICE